MTIVIGYVENGRPKVGQIIEIPPGTATYQPAKVGFGMDRGPRTVDRLGGIVTATGPSGRWCAFKVAEVDIVAKMAE